MGSAVSPRLGGASPIGGRRVFIDTDELRDLAVQLRNREHEFRVIGSEIDHLVRSALQWYPQFAGYQVRGQALAHRAGHIGAQIGGHGSDVAAYAGWVDWREHGGFAPFVGKRHWGPFVVPVPSVHLPAWGSWLVPIAAPSSLPGWVSRLQPWRQRPAVVTPPKYTSPPAPHVDPVPTAPAPQVDKPGDTAGKLKPAPDESEYNADTEIKRIVRKNYLDRQCTSWADFRRRQLNMSPPPVANGGKMATDSSLPPTLGAVVCYGPGTEGKEGHVMIVEEIYADGSFRVSEMNQDGKGLFRTDRIWTKEGNQWRSSLGIWDRDTKKLIYLETLKFTP